MRTACPLQPWPQFKNLAALRTKSPPRPFMRPTIAEEQGNWRALAQSGARAVLAGNNSPGDVMEGVTLQAAGDIRKKITTITTPALQASTIAARVRKLAPTRKKEKVGGLTKPLVETGILLGSLRNEVTKK